jgi:Kef-type K+ transport system membrane component KefB
MYTMVNLFDCINFQLPTLPFQRFSVVVALANNGADVEPSSTIDPSIVLAGVFLSLVVIYFASKVGGEVCIRLNLPPVLGSW